MFALALLLHMAVTTVPLRGEPRCPTVAQIEARLREVQGVAVHQSVFAFIQETSAGLDVSLRTEAGEILVRRQLRSNAPCEDRAAAVAVIIATCVNGLDMSRAVPKVPRAKPKPRVTSPDAGVPEVVPPAVPAEVREPPPESVVPPRPPAAIPHTPKPATPVPSPPPEEEIPQQPEPMGRRDITSTSLEVGGGIAVALSSNGSTFGALFLLSVGPLGSGFGGVLTFASLGARSFAQDTTAVFWDRWMFALGPRFRLTLSSFLFEFQTDAVASVIGFRGTVDALAVEGAGVEWGLGGGMRVTGVPGLWVGVRLHGWPGAGSRSLQRWDWNRKLPRFEVLLTAGLGFETL